MYGKYVIVVFFSIILFILSGCGGEEYKDTQPTTEIVQDKGDLIEVTEATTDTQEVIAMVYAHIDDYTLNIRLEDNSSAKAFVDLLKKGDITVNMNDYGDFEKVGDLGAILPKNDGNITTEAGDVILYQGNSITIYYDKNNWNFTRLGRVEGLSQQELKNVLKAGNGNIEVIFSIK